ncbi:MAG: hypothetical protein E3J22_06235 [Candidatus Aminicenantes bacterium]|nr:MAG: hypothetical protein E3J22_06235 [Candidatus Aminicenantes bacterium]
MKRKSKQRSEYYQSIARYYFKQRGAPFFLSSAELDIIAKWEIMKIPLPVVLEGIKRAFENYLRRPGKRAKIQTLAYCKPQVLKAFDQHKERRVGSERKTVERAEKRIRARTEIKKFLETLPDQIDYLKEAYSRARSLLSQSPVDEEELERIEGEVEELIWGHSSKELKERFKKDVRLEYKIEEGDELLRILRLKLGKALRDRYRIPYVSLFYY